MKYTSIQNQGDVNFQADYSGELEAVKDKFDAACRERKIVWAYLFDVKTGTPVAVYGEKTGTIDV